MKKKFKKITQNFLLLFISSIAILLAMEWISRIYFKQSYTHVTDEEGVVVSMQRDAGHPEKGLRPFFKGRLKSGEFDTEIVLDCLGFRSPVQAGAEMNGTPIHITLLGDSFMFGWGVELDSSFAGFLTDELSLQLLRPVVVTNLAIPGTGQATHLKLMKTTPRPEPDIVIAGLYVIDYEASGNDLTDNLNDFYTHKNKPPASTGRTEKVGLLRKTRRFLKQKSNLYRFFETRVGAILLAKFSGAMNVRRDETTMEKAWHITDSLLVEINHAAREYNAPLVLQYIPNVFDVSRNNNQVYRKLEEISGKNEIPIAPNPIHLFYQAHEDFNLSTFYFVVDGHWREAAHRICAIKMAHYIIENNLLH